MVDSSGAQAAEYFAPSTGLGLGLFKVSGHLISILLLGDPHKGCSLYSSIRLSVSH